MKKYRPTNKPVGSLMESHDLGDFYLATDVDARLAELAARKEAPRE